MVIISKVEVFLGPGNGPKVIERLLKRRTRPRFEKTGESEGGVVLTWLRPRLPGPAHVPAAAPGCKLAALSANPDSKHQYAMFRTFLGNRQCIGDIAFTDDRAELEAMTLSRAAVLLSRWKPTCKGGPNLVTKVCPNGCGRERHFSKKRGFYPPRMKLVWTHHGERSGRYLNPRMPQAWRFCPMCGAELGERPPRGTLAQKDAPSREENARSVGNIEQQPNPVQR